MSDQGPDVTSRNGGDPVKADGAELSDSKPEIFEDEHKRVHNVEVHDIDPALDRAITRKLDTHMMPWLFGIWLLAFMPTLACITSWQDKTWTRLLILRLGQLESGVDVCHTHILSLP